MRWTHSCAFAGASLTCGRCSSKRESRREVGSAALLLALLWRSRAMAATAYVSDELVLGVYAEENNQGQRLATLHSGASVETLAVKTAISPRCA